MSCHSAINGMMRAGDRARQLHLSVFVFYNAVNALAWDRGAPEKLVNRGVFN
jgi:hypothetical protein